MNHNREDNFKNPVAFPFAFPFPGILISNCHETARFRKLQPPDFTAHTFACRGLKRAFNFAAFRPCKVEKPRSSNELLCVSYRTLSSPRTRAHRSSQAGCRHDGDKGCARDGRESCFNLLEERRFYMLTCWRHEVLVWWRYDVMESADGLKQQHEPEEQCLPCRNISWWEMEGKASQVASTSVEQSLQGYYTGFPRNSSTRAALVLLLVPNEVEFAHLSNLDVSMDERETLE